MNEYFNLQYIKEVISLGVLCFGGILALIMIWSGRR